MTIEDGEIEIRVDVETVCYSIAEWIEENERPYPFNYHGFSYSLDLKKGNKVNMDAIEKALDYIVENADLLLELSPNFPGLTLYQKLGNIKEAARVLKNEWRSAWKEEEE